MAQVRIVCALIAAMVLAAGCARNGAPMEPTMPQRSNTVEGICVAMLYKLKPNATTVDNGKAHPVGVATIHEALASDDPTLPVLLPSPPNVHVLEAKARVESENVGAKYAVNFDTSPLPAGSVVIQVQLVTRIQMLGFGVSNGQWNAGITYSGGPIAMTPTQFLYGDNFGQDAIHVVSSDSGPIAIDVADFTLPNYSTSVQWLGDNPSGVDTVVMYDLELWVTVTVPTLPRSAGGGSGQRDVYQVSAAMAASRRKEVVRLRETPETKIVKADGLREGDRVIWQGKRGKINEVIIHLFDAIAAGRTDGGTTFTVCGAETVEVIDD